MLGATREAQQSKVVVLNRTDNTDTLLVDKLQESFHSENTPWHVLLPKEKIAFVFHRGLPDEEVHDRISDINEIGYHPVIFLEIEVSTEKITASFFSLFPAQVMMYMDVYDIIDGIEEFSKTDTSLHESIPLDQLLDTPLTVETAKCLTWLEEEFDEQDVAPLVSKYKTLGDIMRASDEEIQAAVPKIGAMIVEFLRQDYHVE